MTEKEEFNELFEDFFDNNAKQTLSKSNGNGWSHASEKPASEKPASERPTPVSKEAEVDAVVQEMLQKEQVHSSSENTQEEAERKEAYIAELQAQQRKRDAILQQKEEAAKKAEALKLKEEQEHEEALIKEKLLEEEKRKALLLQQEQQRQQELAQEQQRQQQLAQQQQEQQRQQQLQQQQRQQQQRQQQLAQQQQQQQMPQQMPPQQPEQQQLTQQQHEQRRQQMLQQQHEQQRQQQMLQQQHEQQIVQEEEGPLEENREVEVIRSEEIHEILTQIPNWMIRWGISVVFGIIGVIVLMSWFIKYPDVIQGRITLTNQEPPAPVVSKAVGSINLFKSDGDKVREGEVFAYINSATHFEDVSTLNKRLKKNKKALNSGVPININGWENLSLGQLQPSYNNLLTQIRQSKTVQQQANNNEQRALSIDNQIAEVRDLERKQNNNLKLLEKDYRNAIKTLNERHKPLFNDGIISASELEAYENDIRQRQRAFESSKVIVNETTSRLLQLQNQKSELGFSEDIASIQNQNSITDAYSSLVGQIKLWEEQYLLRSPIAGKINYLQFVKDNSYVQREQELAQVIPIQTETSIDGITGELFVPTAGTADLETEQWVNVILDDYPKQDYGMLRGQVDKIADIATILPSGQGEVYKIYVTFPKGLYTTTKENLEFKHNMKGSAEVITEDVRLFHRIFKEIKSALDKL